MRHRHLSIASALLAAIVAATVPTPAANAFTSLAIRAADGSVYFGRTMEFAVELPFQLTWFPTGTAFASAAPGSDKPLSYVGKYGVIGVTVSKSGRPEDLPSLAIVDGLNERGMTFSMLAFKDTSPPKVNADRFKAILAAMDLGTWSLSQFATVAELKAALANQPVWLSPLAPLGNAPTPMHYVFHDRSGASIVVEYTRGRQVVHDNPVGVMTNGPEFTWHLANLANYSFLSNIDVNSRKFGSLSVTQQDIGIATVALPSANTSAGRFVKAAYYAEFVRKAKDPDSAILNLGHVMNNFDRPWDISIDKGQSSGEGVTNANPGSAVGYSSEVTIFTTLADLNRGSYYVRPIGSLNYNRFDLSVLKNSAGVRNIPLARLATPAPDSAGLLSTGH